MGTQRTPFDEEEGWILCRGRVHLIQDGLVACDALGLVPVERCRLCHHLETLAGERDPGSSCATADPLTPPPTHLPR